MDPYGKRPDEPEPLEEVDDFPEERRSPYRSESRRSRYADEDRVRERTGRAREREDMAPRRRRSPRGGFGIGMILGIIAILLVVGGVIGVIIYAVNLHTNPERIPVNDWSTFRPPDGRCSIQMPGTPVSSRIAGMYPEMKYVVERKNEQSTFTLSYCNYANHNDEIIVTMDDRVTLDIRSLRELGEEIADRDCSLGRFTGREIHIKKKKGGGLLIARFYYVFTRWDARFRRTYMLSVEGSYIKPDQGDAARFFNSFQLSEYAKGF